MDILFTDQARQICVDAIKEYVNIPFIYYTHIPAAVISLIMGLLVYIKKRNTISKIFLSLTFLFCLFITLNIITWLSPDNSILMFYWGFFGIVISFIFILCIYFSHLFFFNKTPSIKINYLILILLAPILIFTPTFYNLKYYDSVNCMPIENINFMFYYYSFGIISSVGILLMLISRNLKLEDKSEKRKNIIFTIGIEFFILMLFFASFFASYLYDIGLVSSYNLEPYGLFGVVIFMSFIAYLIVKFKTFDIKLLATQALVWALIILISSQFLFIQTNINRVLTAITLIISAWVGLKIIHSVQKEVALRESLEIANRNQESLIHFISHQLKGFFTKSKMIFSGLMEGDFGDVNPTVLDMAKTGLQSDNNAVAMIQDILGASNLKTGSTQYNFKKITLNTMIKKIAESFEKEIKGKGLEFETKITEEPLVVGVDENQISQVFKNLIDNSAHYTPSGKITVTLRRSADDRKAVFEVADTGVGLSEADKHKLFTEGGKGEESLKVNTNSTGYGLYIVKKIVESHSGRVWAESAGRGKGSKFCVELNLVE